MTPDLYNWLMVLMALGVGYLAVKAQWLAAISLAPKFVERCRDTYARPVLTTLLGILVWLPFLVIGIAIRQQLPLLVLVLTLPTLLAVGGSAGLALKIGTGLPRASDTNQAWVYVDRGGNVLALSLFFPVIGWLVLFPWLALSGAGTAFKVLVTHRSAPRSAP